MLDTLSISIPIFVVFLFAIVAAFEVLRALRTGVTKLSGWPLAVRASCTLWFWICVALEGAIAVVCLWLGVRALTDQLP